MILFIRSNSIISDSRLNRYISYLNKERIPYHILGWDRVGEKPKIKNTTFYKKKSGYNVGGLRAVWYRILWTLFVFKFLCRNKFYIIHGCDLDAVFPAIMYKMIINRKCKVIFDVFDWFSDTLSNQGKLVRIAFSQMEKISVKIADEIILCEIERKNQIPYKFKKPYLILPNIPYFENTIVLESDVKYKFSNDNPIVSYVGGFYDERFLEELVKLARSGSINLLVAGFGSAEITTLFHEISDRENVKFFGKVDYEHGLNIMYNSDIIYAMYCKSNPNHIYAAPNKYYEAMFLGKPILSTKGIIVGDKILKNEMGYVIEENYRDLEQFFFNVNSSDIAEKGMVAKKMWEHYSDYTERFMERKYLNIVQK
ncbi:glycosyltransferase [Sphingobacterium sp.]|uniref:glycosyltransferase n=1 Tax=Sphingobacterium sp. TaxID=341027 RepID=UPI00289B72FC|nr:glycosyltransferase [Sphingobacterium sp.]